MTSGRPAKSHLPSAVRAFWMLSLALTLLCAAVMVFNSQVLRLGYPYDLPFLRSIYSQQDFTCFVNKIPQLHQAGFFSISEGIAGFMYPAPMALLYASFYAAGRHSLLVFFLVTGSLLLWLCILLGARMIREGTRPSTTWLFLSTNLLISYPIWFEYLLANMEICIFIMLALSVLAFLRGHFYVFAILVAVAGSMKLLPLIYLGLLITQRKYRQVALAIILFVLLNVVSLWIVSPPISHAFRGFQEAMNTFRNYYTLKYLPEQTGFDHSLFGLMKSLLRHHYQGNIPLQLLTIYLAVAGAGGIALYFLRIRHLPLLNQVLCLCIASVFLPPTSHDYTLLHLYVPWGLLVLYTIRSQDLSPNVPGLRCALVCFAILFSAESEFIFRHTRVGGQLKAVTLIVLMITALRNPFMTLYDSDTTHLSLSLTEDAQSV